MSAADAAELDATPPLHRRTTWGQWLVFTAVILVLVHGAADSSTRELQARGVGVQGWHMLAVGFVGAAVYLGSAWPVWRVLDSLAMEPGRLWRNGALRGLACVAYVAIDALVTLALLVLAVHLLDADPRLVAEYSQPVDVVIRGSAGFAVLVIAHAVLQRIHERAQRAALTRSLADARLRALSLELRPHFLFNALNGIAALVREDPRRAERMLVRLGDLLRLTQQAGVDGQVPLRRELEQVDLYLELQSMRFGPRLTVIRDVDPSTLGARVPGMLLQPLVENALAHGIGPRAGPGTLELSARREGETLVLRVRDDGVGMPAQPRERTGVGTTRARLAAMFGAAQRFTLASEAGGTAAEVRIPYQPWRAT